MTVKLLIFLVIGSLVIIFLKRLHNQQRYGYTWFALWWGIIGVPMIGGIRWLESTISLVNMFGEVAVFLYFGIGLAGFLYWTVIRPNWPIRGMTIQALLDKSYDFYTRGDNKRAMQILEQVVARTPRSARARYGIGLILNEEEKFEKAIPQLEFAHELSPHSVDVLIELGYALSSNRNHLQALAALEEAQSIEPDNVEVSKAIEIVKRGSC